MISDCSLIFCEILLYHYDGDKTLNIKYCFVYDFYHNQIMPPFTLVMHWKLR